MPSGELDADPNASYFHLQASNLRIFTKAITALGKLGEILYLEPAPEGLAVRTFHRSHTANGFFLFSNAFFSDTDTSSIDPNKCNLCRISMKGALSAFKGAHSSDKNYFSCEMWINPIGDNMRVQMQMIHDVRRVYEINMLEPKLLARNCDKSKLKNIVVLPAGTLLSYINQMHSDCDELVLAASKDKFQLKNFSFLDRERRRPIKSEATIRDDLFSRYSVERETEICFSAKEFKAFVFFASQHSVSVGLYFDLPEMYLVAAIECDIHYTGELQLSTGGIEREVTDQTYTPDAMRNEISTATGSRQRTTTQPDAPPREQRTLDDSFDDDEITPTQRIPEKTKTAGGSGGEGERNEKDQEMEEEEDRVEVDQQQQRMTPGPSQADPWTDAAPPVDWDPDDALQNDPPPQQSFPPSQMPQSYMEQQVPRESEQDHERVEEQEEESRDLLCSSPSPPRNARDRRFRRFFMSSSSATQHASQQQSSQDTRPLAMDTQMK